MKFRLNALVNSVIKFWNPHRDEKTVTIAMAIMIMLRGQRPDDDQFVPVISIMMIYI